jgi:hypothetical protein
MLSHTKIEIQDFRTLAEEHSKKGEIEKAQDYFIQAANLGDASSQFEVANYFYLKHYPHFTNPMLISTIHHYLMQSAKQRYPAALTLLKTIHEEKILCNENLKTDQKLLAPPVKSVALKKRDEALYEPKHGIDVDRYIEVGKHIKTIEIDFSHPLVNVRMHQYLIEKKIVTVWNEGRFRQAVDILAEDLNLLEDPSATFSELCNQVNFKPYVIYFKAIKATLSYLESSQHPSSLILFYINTIKELKTTGLSNLPPDFRKPILKIIDEVEQKIHTNDAQAREISYFTSKIDLIARCLQELPESMLKKAAIKIIFLAHEKLKLDEWLLVDKEVIKKAFIDLAQIYFFHLHAFSLVLERIVPHISNQQDFNKYSDAQEYILTIKGNYLLFLTENNIKSLRELYYYSANFQDFLHLKRDKDLLDDFGHPLDITIQTLIKENNISSGKLIAIDYKSFHSKQQLFNKIKLAAYEVEDRIEKIDTLIREAKKEYPFFIPHLLFLRFQAMYDDILLLEDKGISPEEILTNHIPALFQYFKTEGFDKTFVEALAYAWTTKSDDIFYAPFNLHTPITRFAILTQVLLQYTLTIANRITQSSKQLNEIIRQNFNNILTLQTSLLSFFQYADMPNIHLNGWLFLNEKTETFTYFLPNHMTKRYVNHNMHLFTDRPEFKGISLKLIQSIAMNIERELTICQDKLSQLTPEFALTHLKTIILSNNVSLTREIFGTKMDSFFMAPSRNNPNSDSKEEKYKSLSQGDDIDSSIAQLIKKIDEDIRIKREIQDKIELKKSALLDEKSTEILQKIDVMEKNDKPKNENQTLQKIKKKKKKKKQPPKNIVTTNEKKLGQTVFTSMSSIILNEEKSSGSLDSRIKRIFVSARELIPNLIKGDASTRSQANSYITQIKFYTEIQHEEGIRMVAFLSLRDFYALMAIKYINTNAFDQAINNLKQAISHYNEVAKFPKFLLLKYKDCLDMALLSSHQIEIDLKKSVDALRARINKSNEKVAELKKTRGEDWWYNHIEYIIEPNGQKYLLGKISSNAEKHQKMLHYLKSYEQTSYHWSSLNVKIKGMIAPVSRETLSSTPLSSFVSSSLTLLPPPVKDEKFKSAQQNIVNNYYRFKSARK